MKKSPPLPNKRQRDISLRCSRTDQKAPQREGNNAIIFALANTDNGHPPRLNALLWARVFIVIPINAILVSLASFFPLAAMVLYLGLPIYTFISHTLCR